MKYAGSHILKFSYSEPVSESHFELRLHPSSNDSQRCLSFELEGSERFQAFPFRDYLGNMVWHFSIPRRHNGLTIEARWLVELTPPAKPSKSRGKSAVAQWKELEIAANGELLDFTTATALVCMDEALQAWAGKHAPAKALGPRDHLAALCKAIAAQVKLSRTPPAARPLGEALKSGKVSREEAVHILLAVLRRQGYPARFVRGYEITLTSKGKTAAIQACWAQAWSPGEGFIGCCPLSGGLIDGGHIPVCVGMDSQDTLPWRNVFRGFSERTLTEKIVITPGNGGSSGL
ncbi:MAG: hypothetical protein GMKNLPBB_00045 [Myxococcota bacterium]|nr:hypothetical protein [Myxococcota bacterium]